jgi:hypothetical protein
MVLEEVDQQYRYDQYLRKLEKLQRQYWKLQGSRMPLPMYSAPQPLPPPLSYNPGTLIEYPSPTQYMTYPPVIDPGAGSFGPPLNTGYGLPFNRGYGSGPTVNFGTVRGMNLPPKIRVIFIPPGQSFSQQPCTGPLVSSLFNFSKKERNDKNNYVDVFLRLCHLFCTIVYHSLYAHFHYRHHYHNLDLCLLHLPCNKWSCNAIVILLLYFLLLLTGKRLN